MIVECIATYAISAFHRLHIYLLKYKKTNYGKGRCVLRFKYILQLKLTNEVSERGGNETVSQNVTRYIFE